MSNMPYIYMHADDFGMTSVSSERILECWKNGSLNSVSIMPNGCLDYAVEKIKETDLACVIHINLVEGKTVYQEQNLDMLVDEKGYMKNTFFPFLIQSLIPGKRKRLKQQLYLEIKSQILEVMKCFPEKKEVLIDSHQHVHMIPLIFQTLLEVIDDCQIKVKYLRIPAEPLMPFIKERDLYKTYRPINIVKSLVLNCLWLFNRGRFKKTGIKSAVFCGIMFSGQMDEKRVMKVFPHFYKIAKNKNSDLELLFHPGFIEQNEEFMDPHKESFKEFYLSKGRKMEKNALTSNRIKEMADALRKER